MSILGSDPISSIADYNNPKSQWYGRPINHTLVFQYIDEQGRYHLFSQNPDDPIYETVISADQASQYSEVRVDKSNGPYETTPSNRSLAEGNGGGSGSPFGYFPNLSGGLSWGSYGFAWGDAAWAYGQNPWGAWGNLGNFSVLASSIDGRNQGLWFAGNLAGQGLVGAMEPGLGCFVAGTPVLMADGSEKPIDAIQAGEAVLAWNDES